jgi:FecR protein
MSYRIGMGGVLALAMAITGWSGALAAEDGVWSVSRSSGEVWLTATGASQASLTQHDTLKPGDTIRTGPHGRVLLTRGEETILISPNSVIGLPTEQKDGLSTTILQRAGSILLNVEKRDVKHFEVETPYLAAVVKGTHFQVTVNAANTRVEVQRGQVEVADFKTGQIAQLMPGQAATSFAKGAAGLSLSGSGTFNPVQQGKPRASAIERVTVPKGGLHAPHGAADGTIRALGPAGTSQGRIADHTQTQPSRLSAPMHSQAIRLTTALGEVHLNVQKATHGLAHGAVLPGAAGNASRDTARSTIWGDSSSTTSASATASANSGSNNGNGNSSSPGASAASGAASPAAAAVTAASSAPQGNGNDPSPNGNGNPATGNGKAKPGPGGPGGAGPGGPGPGGPGGPGNGNSGVGNGNNGNGHGNGGVGNGNGNGNSKH